MKRKIIALLLPCMLAFSLTACGNAASPDQTAGSAVTEESTDSAADTDANTEAGETEASDSQTATAADAPDYTLTIHENYEDAGPSGEFDHIYCLYLTDAQNAVMTEEFHYSDSNYSDYHYTGTYETGDAGITFTHPAANDMDNDFSYFFAISDDTLTSVDYVTNNEAINKIVGTYTCNDVDYGSLTLTIGQSGNAELTTDKDVAYTGNISVIDDRYDLMVSNTDEDVYLDWYVYFDGSTFSHEDYYDPSYEGVEGTYVMEGDLGELTVEVNANGASTTTVNIKGAETPMSGYLYIDDTGTPYSLYLSSDGGTSLDLTLESIESDGETVINYSGTITYPLAAG